MNNEESRLELDVITNSVMRKMRDRAVAGRSKYGVGMDRDDLSTIDWLTHAQEEAMDLSLYLERVRMAVLLDESTIDGIINIVNEEPNDQKLGKIIRKLYGGK